MKKLKLTELNEFKNKFSKSKNFKKILLLSLLGLTLCLSLIIWAGYSATKFVVTQTEQILNSTVANQSLEKIQAETPILSGFNPVNCWSHTQTLLNINPWLEKPLADNILSLKTACFLKQELNCKEKPCSPTQKTVNEKGGITI